MKRDYPVSSTLKQAVYDKMDSCIQNFEQYYGVAVVKKVKILFNLKGKTAGWASYNQGYIRLNVDILENYKHKFIDEVVPHELAHILTEYCFRLNIFTGCNKQSHGRHWKNVSRVIGSTNPVRCHRFECKPARKIRRWAYECDCHTHALSTTLHNRIQKKGQKRICLRCKKQIVFNGKEVIQG